MTTFGAGGRLTFFLGFLRKGGDLAMDFLKNLVEEAATVFFTTLAAGTATMLISWKTIRGKRKTTPRRRKQKGGSSVK